MNATDLSRYQDNDFDLTCFMDAAHHMESKSDLIRVLTEIDRVTSTDGFIYFTDLTRPTTRLIADHFSCMISNLNQNLGSFEHHSAEFHHSILASWTQEEILSSTPKTNKRNWIYITQPGFSYSHTLIGIPKGLKFVNPNPLKPSKARTLLPKKLKILYKIHLVIMILSRKKRINFKKNGKLLF